MKIDQNIHQKISNCTIFKNCHGEASPFAKREIVISLYKYRSKL